MDVVTNVFFDGRFWIALIEKIGDDGLVLVGRHVFGSEPTNGDLVRFYLFACHEVRCLESPIRPRIKAARKPREQERITSKSKRIFGDLLAVRLGERQLLDARARRDSDEERYLLRQEKRKEKKRGH